MKGQEAGFQLPAFLPRLSHDKQDTLLKLFILSIAAILCEFFFSYEDMITNFEFLARSPLLCLVCLAWVLQKEIYFAARFLERSIRPWT